MLQPTSPAVPDAGSAAVGTDTRPATTAMTTGPAGGNAGHGTGNTIGGTGSTAASTAGAAGADPFAEFRVSVPAECLRLLHELRDGHTPVLLNAADGSVLASTLWSVDPVQQRLNLSVDGAAPQLARLVDTDEVAAVAYLHSVKLQFDLHGLVLVRGTQGCVLQAALPQAIYRFQRRQSFRVRPLERHAPAAHFRHPAIPEMALALRVLDVGIGGCALWLPHGVPPLQAGTQLGEIRIALDADTRFVAPVTLQHVSALGNGSADSGSDDSSGGVRLGCEWPPLPPDASRLLQRWIDRTQQRRRLLD